jgi:hypothetical protein
MLGKRNFQQSNTPAYQTPGEGKPILPQIVGNLSVVQLRSTEPGAFEGIVSYSVRIRVGSDLALVRMNACTFYPTASVSAMGGIHGFKMERIRFIKQARK